jgi:hypothetical protein
MRRCGALRNQDRVRSDAGPIDMSDSTPEGAPRVAFVARLVGRSEAFGVLTVGIAEQPDGGGRSLLFMSPLPAEGGAVLGVCNELQATADGGVVDIRIESTSLRVQFRDGVGHGLGLADDTTVALDIDVPQLDVLKSALQEIIARCDPAPTLAIA